jgi:formate dehydrogenase beta subunit
VRVIAAPCVGRCDTRPVAVVGRNPVDHATVARSRRPSLAARSSPTLPRTSTTRLPRRGGYACSRACIEPARAHVDDVLAVSTRRPARPRRRRVPDGAEVEVRARRAGPRVVAINADEGEPGTFKDRYCMETDPHRVLEGMLIAAWAVGADDVFFYLRDEYAACRAILTREIAALEADPPCALPRIHLRRGAGAYICGEETSLIESIEGKRGEPRLRPPFPAQAGVFGRPTLVQNVETLYWLRTSSRIGAERSPRAAGPATRACASSPSAAASRGPACTSRRTASPRAS